MPVELADVCADELVQRHSRTARVQDGRPRTGSCPASQESSRGEARMARNSLCRGRQWRCVSRAMTFGWCQVICNWRSRWQAVGGKPDHRRMMERMRQRHLSVGYLNAPCLPGGSLESSRDPQSTVCHRTDRSRATTLPRKPLSL